MVTSRKKVVIVTPDSDTRVGGVERFSNLLADALRDSFDVSFFEVRKDAAGRGPAALGWMRDSRQTGGAIVETRPDLVITGVTVGAGFDPAVPRIHVCHGTMPMNAWAATGEPLKARLSAMAGGGMAERVAARNSSALVAVSRTTGKEVARTLFLKRPVRVIENSIDTSMFRPVPRDQARADLGWDDSSRIALFVGRPERRKGIDVAVEAARRAGWRLRVAGPVAYPGTEWAGLLDQTQLRNAYSAADAVIFPTRYEACSYTVLEAIACGANLLTTRRGWVTDVAKELPLFDSILLEPEVDAFERALRSLASASDNMAFRMAIDEVRARVLERNTIRSFQTKWSALCSEVLNGATATESQGEHHG